MALRDHFRPPLSERRQWHSFHHAWATYLSSQINLCLPTGYFAAPNIQYGIEIDVAAFRDGEPSPQPSPWAPPPARQSIALPMLENIVEIGIFHQEGGVELAGAVELVSPANKDRPDTRDAFLNKCLTYLQGGVGLVIVDVVTSRLANLHLALLARLGEESPPPPTPLYAASYRPVERDGSHALDIWREDLHVGGDLPTMPLWVRGDLCFPVDLAGTYDRTCREQRMPMVEV